GQDANGLVINAGGSVVRGLAIDGFSGSGIVLQGRGGNLVAEDIIGSDGAGHPGLDGVFLNAAPGNTIGGATSGAGNVNAGNGSSGLQLYGPGATGNVIQGNRIGTDIHATPRLGNTYGLFLNAASGNQVGGPGGAANLIAGNRRARV